jgi:hypothetical protein
MARITQRAAPQFTVSQPAPVDYFPLVGVCPGWRPFHRPVARVSMNSTWQFSNWQFANWAQAGTPGK